MYFVYVFDPTTTSLEAMGLKLYYIIMTSHAHHGGPFVFFVYIFVPASTAVEAWA